MLLSGRRTVISVVFAATYLFGIVLDTVLLLVLGGAAGLGGGTASSGAVAWLQLVVGVLLVLLGLDEWSKRPKAGETTKLPRWMAAMENFTVAKAAGVSLFLSAFRPKNVLMFAAASVAIATGHLGVADSVVAVALFAVISASTVVALVIAAILRQAKIKPWLTEVRVWLETNTKAMMGIVLVRIGVVEVGKGIGGIF
jgi:hypothetical protein